MAPAPHPFFDFLQELRRRGVPVSLSQHQDVARLCARLGGWPGCDAAEMARALAALLGRSAPETRAIEQAFFQHYAAAYFFADNQAPLPPGVKQAALGEVIDRAQRQPQRRWFLLIVGLVVSALLGLVASQLPDLLRLHRARMPEAGAPAPPVEPPSPVSPPVATAPKPITREPTLPPPVRAIHRAQQAVWVLPGPLLLLLLLYGLRRQKELRGWARKYWAEVRGALTGATDFELRLSDLREPLARQDLEDMATVLGRGFEHQGAARLNVPKSVQRTLERAALPTLVFDHRAGGRPLLVLCDISADMRPWERKVTALWTGLERRGVRLEVYYFDGNAARLSKARHGRSLPLGQLQRQNPDAALLIISTGSQLLDSQEEKRRAGKLAPWLELARRFRLRAWLNPIDDDERWRPVLRRPSFVSTYLRVLPMTRAGLLAAAYELAQEPERRVYIPQAATRPARLVEEADVQRLQRLMALYPGAPLELIELVRQQFCPEVPDAVVLDLLTQSVAHSSRTLRVTDAELARLLRELQDQDAPLDPPQRQEEQVRRYLLKVLKDSEPADAASLGHLKWRLRKAMQQIYLHDPDHRNIDEAVATLSELVRGPLWEEAHGELWALAVPGAKNPHGVPVLPIAKPVQERLKHEVMTLVKQTAGGEVAQPQGPRTADSKAAPRPRWLRLPKLPELAPAVLLAAALLAVVSWKKVGVEQVEHIKGYALTTKLKGAESAVVELRVETQKDGLPEGITLCLDDACQNTAGEVKLVAGSWTGEREQPKTDTYMHVQARLPKGNLGYSDAVLIPGYTPPKKVMVRVAFFDAENGRPVPGVKYTLTDASGRAIGTEAGQAVAVRVGPVSVNGEAKGYGAFAQTSQPLFVDAELKIDLREQVPPGMVKIPAGRFQMGSNDFADEKPIHSVDVSAFYMDETEVTMEKFWECVKAGRCDPPWKTVKWDNIRQEDMKTDSQFCNANSRGRGKHPVNCVDWNQAQAFCRWAGKRLPTEAEWEYAARGTTGRKYPWGNPEPDKSNSTILNACGTECVEMAKKKGLTWTAMYEINDGWETTAPVGTFKRDKSPFGVLDLGGNVSEWVSDLYTECYKKPGCPTNPNARVLRGGSWSNFDPQDARAADRDRNAPANRGDSVGFRCARTK